LQVCMKEGRVLELCIQYAWTWSSPY